MIRVTANTLDVVWGGDYRNPYVKQIGINGKGTYGDFGLFLAPGLELSPAEPRIKSVAIPGKDGELDLTESLTNDIIYDNRTLDFELLFLQEDKKEQSYIYREFVAFCHGKRATLTLPDDDHDTYLTGRVKVGPLVEDKSIARAKVSADLEPWRYRKSQKEYILTVGTGSTTATIENEGRKLVHPTFTTNGEISVIFGGVVAQIPQGTYTIDGIAFKQGGNTLSVTADTADTTVSIKYREGWM
jgi:hypothetical protein